MATFMIVEIVPDWEAETLDAPPIQIPYDWTAYRSEADAWFVLEAQLSDVRASYDVVQLKDSPIEKRAP